MTVIAGEKESIGAPNCPILPSDQKCRASGSTRRQAGLLQTLGVTSLEHTPCTACPLPTPLPLCSLFSPELVHRPPPGWSKDSGPQAAGLWMGV